MVDATLTPVCDFLERHAPFDALPRATVERLATQLDVEYFRRDTWVYDERTNCDRLYIIRTGALGEWSSDGELLDEYGEGDAAGAHRLTTAGGHDRSPTRATRLRAVADTLVYTLSEPRFADLCRENPDVAVFFSERVAERLKAAIRSPSASEATVPVWSQTLRSLLARPPLTVRGETSIREAAQLMTQARFSSVLVVGADELGIVTDHDLRSRVIGAGRSVDDPVRTVMSSPVVSVDIDDTLLDVMMQMLDRGIHHLAVRERGLVMGMVAVTDVVQTLAANPVIIMRDIRRQQSVAELVRVARQRADVVLQLLASGARARDVHRVLTRIGDALTRRLIELGWQEMRSLHNEPAGEYAWVAFGSQARNEHTLGSDQDNGLIMTDALSGDDQGLGELARWVCNGLDACGYPRCPGDIMAVTSRWRQPLRNWRQYFTQWVREPSPEAIMRGSIFFDLRSVHGNVRLVDELRQHIAREVQAQPLFIAHLARSALSRRPPLGLFGRFVLEPNGDHAPSLDLKLRGLAPIVDLARVYALEAGCEDANTLERLRCAAENAALSSSGSTELADAFELIAMLRLRHHARRLKAGLLVDHMLDPQELSSSERKHLRDAFSVVKTIQNNLQHSHQLGNLSP